MGYFSIHEIARQISSNEKSIDEVSETLPCYLHINDLSDFSVLDTDKKILDFYKISVEEIREQGFEIVKKYVHKDYLVHAVNANMDYIERQEDLNYVSFLQRICRTGMEDQIFHSKGKIIEGNRILNVSISMTDIEFFNRSIFDICDDTMLMKRKSPFFDRLTKKEITVSKELVHGNNIREISEKLGCSSHTVRHHKSNIYRKLEVKNYFEFYGFIKNFKIHL